MISYNEIVAIEYAGEIAECSNDTKIKKLLKKLSSSFEEVFILKTCQRLSIYVYADAFFHLYNFLLKEGINHKATSFVNTKSVAKHLFEVASAVKSNTEEESDILETIDKYLKLAENQKTIGPFLSKLIIASIECGKSMQKRSNSLRLQNSFLSTGMDFVYDHFQSFNLRVLVLGSNKEAESILKHLKNEETEKIFITSPTFEDAERLANKHQVSALKSEKMSFVFSSLDVIFCCGNKDILLNIIYDHQESTERDKSNDKRPIVIDFESYSPFSESSSAEQKLFSEYYNHYTVGSDGLLTGSDSTEASEMIVNCIEDFCRDIQRMKFLPVLKKYWAKVKELEAEELNQLFSQLENTSEETHELIRKFSDTMLQKVSHAPFEAINKLAESPLENQEYLLMINKLLNGSEDC